MQQQDILALLHVMRENHGMVFGNGSIESVSALLSGINLGFRLAGVERTPKFSAILEQAGTVLGFDGAKALSPMHQFLQQDMAYSVIIDRLIDLEVYKWTHGAYSISAPLNQTPSRWAAQMRSTLSPPHADTDSG